MAARPATAPGTALAGTGLAGTGLAGTGLAGTGLAHDAAALLTAIGAVRRTARRAVQQAWDQEPLPPARSELLLLVARRPGITVAEAAHELHLAQNTISTLVSKLTAEQLLDRGTDTADRRAVRLTVAPAGRARLAGYRDLRAELAGRALAGLTAADQQALAAAVPALHRLAGQLEAR